MRLLGCSETEAEDIIATDTAIDKGQASPYDLDPEAQKIAKKFAHVKEHTKKPMIPDSKPRERKGNPTKAGIIESLYNFLVTQVDNVTITNKERQIAFEMDNQKYELTLVAKRAPKK